MQRDEALNLLAAFPQSDPAAAWRAGVALLKADYPELLHPHALRLAEAHPHEARCHQLAGMTARACGESASALEAFRTAAALAPRDPAIAHFHARAALEAGQASTHLFAAAAQLAPQDGIILLGQAAAFLAEGRGAEGLSFLADLLARNPFWVDGHRSFASLAKQLGADPLESVRRALADHPRDEALNYLTLSIPLQARDLAEAARAARTAREALGAPRWLARLTAHIASEQGRLDDADALFAATGAPVDINEAWPAARHMLRRRQGREAAALCEAWLDQPGSQAIWPYLVLAWRITGDPRHEWLEGDDSLVGVYDIGYAPEELARLGDHLRTLHRASAAPLDQSVRGGTQTDGNLLLRTDPAIQQLRQRLLEIVAEHIAQLPPAAAGHPTLLARRNPVRVAGAWSVRLEGAGFHTDHVHPQGWFSSALYVALPESLGADDAAPDGWLSLGEARDLVPELRPLRLIEPKAGRLVLFPSIMWHGTRPFSAGERLTVAFDIARPRQD